MKKMTNDTFDRWRFYSEILGHVLTFVLAVSEIIGFEYGAELAALIGAFNIMRGAILQSARAYYLEQGEHDLTDEAKEWEA